MIGGMGPLATVDFLRKVIIATPSSSDQEHLPLVVASNPQIPDRTAAILSGGPSPLPALLRSLNVLQACGANYVAIPCNTAHFWHSQIQSQSDVEILHIVDAVAAELRSGGVPHGTIGLLATTATIRGAVYQERLAALGFEIIALGEPDQTALMSLIYGVKSGALAEQPDLLDPFIGKLESAGADATVLACTELPLLKLSASHAHLIIDSTLALARLCVRRAFDG